MNSAGCSLEYGLIAAPMISTRFSGTIGGPPSIGSPAPLRIRPSMSRDTLSLIVSPRNFTVDWRSIPAVPSKIWTTTMSFEESRTWPRLREPSGRPTSTSSPYPTHSVFSTKMRGPAISVIVRYSVGISSGSQFLEFLIHLRERLRQFLVELRLVLDAREQLPRFQGGDVLRRDIEFHGPLSEVRVFLDRADQFELPLGGTERVDRVVRVLLEKDLADHAGDFERELLVRRQRVRAHETHDLLELRFLLKGPLGPGSEGRPFLVHVLPDPLAQDVDVQAVRLEPVDRREVPPRAEGRVEGPEHLHDAQSALGDGLREIAAARRDRADHAHGTFQAAQSLGPARTLVELAQPRGQVCRKTFFSGHLFKTAGNFPHRLRPSRGRVGHQGDVVPHVPVVLREGHARVDGRLASRDGHVARVRDQRHAFHQRRARVGVLQFREGRKDLGHLVPTFAAADVDDDLRVAPLRELLFGDRFSRPEAARDRGGAALRNREEEIENPLARDQRNRGQEPILHGSWLSNRPCLKHSDLLAAVECHDDLVDLERPLTDLRDLPAPEVRRDHDA